MKLFIDTEFTGLKQNTNLISIGIISENNHEFYAEFSDYNKMYIDKWLYENVIENLIFQNLPSPMKKIEENNTMIYGDSKYIKNELEKWLLKIKKEFNVDNFEIWSDCLSYDWVLFNELWGGALFIPNYIYYIPFDICTIFKLKEIDPDISREEFSGIYDLKKHNALDDARIIKYCYELLT